MIARQFGYHHTWHTTTTASLQCQEPFMLFCLCMAKNNEVANLTRESWRKRLIHQKPQSRNQKLLLCGNQLCEAIRNRCDLLGLGALSPGTCAPSGLPFLTSFLWSLMTRLDLGQDYHLSALLDSDPSIPPQTEFTWTQQCRSPPHPTHAL